MRIYIEEKWIEGFVTKIERNIWKCTTKKEIRIAIEDYLEAAFFCSFDLVWKNNDVEKRRSIYNQYEGYISPTYVTDAGLIEGLKSYFGKHGVELPEFIRNSKPEI